MTLAPEHAVELPEAPSLDIPKMLGEAASFEFVFRRRLGTTVSTELAVRWTQELQYGSKLWDGDADNVGINLQNTFLQYVGRTVDARFVRILARQLAARGSSLDDGLLLAYERPVRPEWLYLEITAVTKASWRDNQEGTQLELDALTGHPAGNLLRLKVPTSWLSFLAYRIGFTRRVLYNDDPRLFVGLRFIGFLRPRGDEDREADFADWQINAKLKKYNSEIVKLRTRFDHDLAECPLDFEHNCDVCNIRLQGCPASYLRGQIVTNP